MNGGGCVIGVTEQASDGIVWTEENVQEETEDAEGLMCGLACADTRRQGGGC